VLFVVQRALEGVFFVMPFLFGIGFIAPATAAVLAHFALDAPIGLTPVQFGLLIGGSWGLYATIRGSWL
jgi:hypothetical protein